MSLENKRIVVLGGSAGLGFGVAQAAADAGAEVVIASSRQERVDQAVARLPASARGKAVDLADEQAIIAFFDGIGPFDHLAYTAGDPLALAPVETLDFAVARKFFELRYWGAFMAAKHAQAHIRPGGSITLTNGIVGQRPWKGWATISSIAAALEGLTRALAVEFAPLRINAVCPGIVRTDLWSGMGEAEREEMYRTRGAALPVGRVGEVEDVAEAYLYLMRQGYGTGQVLTVDGGAVLV